MSVQLIRTNCPRCQASVSVHELRRWKNGVATIVISKCKICGNEITTVLCPSPGTRVIDSAFDGEDNE